MGRVRANYNSMAATPNFLGDTLGLPRVVKQE
jgi:hypothetical protein